jgi:hypothetical protein
MKGREGRRRKRGRRGGRRRKQGKWECGRGRD